MVSRKLAVICVLVEIAIGIVGGLALRSSLATASGGGYAQVEVPNLALGRPLKAAHLTRSAALGVAEKGMNPTLFTHPFTVEYGSFTDNSYFPRVPGEGKTIAPVGTRDVWKVTITGLRIGRPCGPDSCPPRASTLVIFIDDQLGKGLERQEY